MISAFSKRIVDLESKCLLMQRQLNDLRARFVNSFLSDDELETGQATLKSTILRLDAELQQQTKTLDDSRAQMVLQTQCLDQMRQELNALRKQPCMDNSLEEPFTVKHATEYISTRVPSPAFEEQTLENKPHQSQDTWSAPESPFQFTFSQELQGINQQGDSMDTPRTSIQLPRSRRAVCRFRPEDFSTNQNNNELSSSPPPNKIQRLSTDEDDEVASINLKHAERSVTPADDMDLYNRQDDELTTQSQMEAWLQYLLNTLKSRNSELESLKESLNERAKHRDDARNEAGRSEYKLAVLQQDLRRRAQTLGRMLEELDQLTSPNNVEPEKASSIVPDSDVIRLAIGTKGLKTDDRVQIVARAVDNDRDNKVQDWPTLMELIREAEKDPEKLMGSLNSQMTDDI